MGPPPVLNLVDDDFDASSKLAADVTEEGFVPCAFAVNKNRSLK